VNKNKESTIKMVQVQSLTLDENTMKLRDWLVRVRLSIMDFAKLVGVSRSYVHMILMGDRVPSKDLLDRIKYISMGKVKEFEDLCD